MTSGSVQKKLKKSISIMNLNIDESSIDNKSINYQSVKIPIGTYMSGIVDINFNLENLPQKEHSLETYYEYMYDLYSTYVHPMKDNVVENYENYYLSVHDLYDAYVRSKSYFNTLLSVNDYSSYYSTYCRTYSTYHTYIMKSIYENYREPNNSQVAVIVTNNIKKTEIKEKNNQNNYNYDIYTNTFMKDNINMKIKSKIENKIQPEKYIKAYYDMISWYVPLKNGKTLLISLLQVDLGPDIPDFVLESGLANNAISGIKNFNELIQ